MAYETMHRDIRAARCTLSIARFGGQMLPSAGHTFCLIGILLAASSVLAQEEIANPHALLSAKTVFFNDQSGKISVGQKSLAELHRWGRFQVVQDRKDADLILVLSADSGRGGDLVLSGGQTGSIDSQGHVAEDSIPNYNKLAPDRYAFLIVRDAHTNENLWSASRRWAGLLTGFDSVGEELLKALEKQTEEAQKRSSLKLIKSVNPSYPEETAKKLIDGTVIVRIVVDKYGKVASARPVSGPPELLPPSVEAALQYQFEPPQNAPVTTEVQMSYGYSPKPCPPGGKGDHATIAYAEKLPMEAKQWGALKVVRVIDQPTPPYPAEAKDAGIEGDLELFITIARSGEVVGARVIKSLDPSIDAAALTTVRTWKFKVTHGEQAGFPIKFLYRITCSSSTGK